MDSRIDLLPCPFCGAAAFAVRKRNLDEFHCQHTPGCFLEDFDDTMDLHGGEPPDQPFETWNTRSA